MKLPPEKRQPSLDDLFALKRAERPSQEFWDDFQREFHVRQRAAAIEPKRWWFVLPRVFANLSRYQMPMGAAAVLAVTFLSFREYREPGLEVAFAPTSPVVADTDPVQFAVDVPAERSTSPSSEVADRPVINADVRAQEAVAHVAATPSQSVPLSPMMVWAGVSAGQMEVAVAEPSPSARSIAANLAAVRAEQPEIVRMPGEPTINLTADMPQAEPLAAVAIATGSAREPLFAYQPVGSRLNQDGDAADAPDVHSRIASRLSDDLLYDSVRRLTAGGDRLTLKF